MIVSATPSSIKELQLHPHRPSDCTMLTSSSTVISLSEHEDTDLSEHGSPTPAMQTTIGRPVALNQSSKRGTSTGNSIGPQSSSIVMRLEGEGQPQTKKLIPKHRQHFLSDCSLPGFMDDGSDHHHHSENQLITQDQVSALLESRDARITELEGQLRTQTAQANQRITDLEEQVKNMATQFEQVMRTLSTMSTAMINTATSNQTAETDDMKHQPKRVQPSQEETPDEKRVRLSLLPRTASSLLSDSEDDSESSNSPRRMTMSDESKDDMADDSSKMNSSSGRRRPCLLPLLRAESSSVVSVDVDFQRQIAAANAARACSAQQGTKAFQQRESIKEEEGDDENDDEECMDGSGNVTLEEAVKEDYVVKQRESILQLLDYAKRRACTMLEESQSTTTTRGSSTSATQGYAPFKRGSSSPSSLVDYTRARAITTSDMTTKEGHQDNRSKRDGATRPRRGSRRSPGQRAPYKKAISSPSSLVDYTKQRSNSVALKSSQELPLSPKKKNSSSPTLMNYGRGGAPTSGAMTSTGVTDSQKNASWQQPHQRSRRPSFQPSINIKPILEESSQPPSQLPRTRSNSHSTVVGEEDDPTASLQQLPGAILLRRSSSCSMLSMESASCSNLYFDKDDCDGEEGSAIVKHSCKNRSTRRRRRSSSLGSLRDSSKRSSLLGDYSSLFCKQRPPRGQTPLSSTGQRTSDISGRSSDMETSIRWSLIFPDDDRKRRDNIKYREEGNNSAPLEHTSATAITLALPPMRRYKTSGDPTTQRSAHTAAFEEKKIDSSFRSAVRKEQQDGGTSDTPPPLAGAKLQLRSSIKSRSRSNSPIRDSLKSAATETETLDVSNQASYAELKSSRGSRGTKPGQLLQGGSHHSTNSLLLAALEGASNHSLSLDDSNHASYAALKSNRGTRGIKLLPELDRSVTASSGNSGASGEWLFQNSFASLGGGGSSTHSRRDRRNRNKSPTRNRDHPLRCATTTTSIRKPSSAPSLLDLGQKKKKRPVDAAPNATWGERSCNDVSWTRGSSPTRRNRRRRMNGASPDDEDNSDINKSLNRQSSSRSLNSNIFLTKTRIRRHKGEEGSTPKTLAKTSPLRLLSRSTSLKNTEGDGAIAPKKVLRALRRTSSLKNVQGSNAA